MEPASLTLKDLGESRIVSELIAPRFPFDAGHVLGIGDDCALLPPPAPGQLLVTTIDPCPTPVVCMLEGNDYYHYGWMSVLINISDLAAMGAHPIGMLMSTVMNENMAVREYERFLDGVVDASREWSCPIVGGNIKDGPSFTATGSAFGSVGETSAMRRIGMSLGDRVLVIGDMGLFFAAVLSRVKRIAIDQSSDALSLHGALHRPVARLREGIALAETARVTACMDSSDGVIGCLRTLAGVNQMDIVIDAQSLRPISIVEEIAERVRIDVRKLMLSWGDWQLVCTCNPEHEGLIVDAVRSLGTPCHDIGVVARGDGHVWLQEGDKQAELSNFTSERFCGTSVFTHGLEAYVESLQAMPLVRQI